MNCEILRILYVKSNGEILCNDDFGERISLGFIPNGGGGPNIHQVLNNDRFRHIRAALDAGEAPWPEICAKCAFFRPTEQASRDLLAERIIEKLQIEASLACALKCPYCSNLDQLRNRPGGIHFAPEALERLLLDFLDHGYDIKSIEYCGQGEPLNNPRFSELVATARRLYPTTIQRVITNGNHDHLEKLGGEFVEETIVSIDGALQENYEKYRINGKIDRALDYLRDASRSHIPKGGSVIWKYILFETNDTDKEILEAQRIACEAGITRLWFVHSHTANRSKRYTFKNPFAIPVTYPRVAVGSHPSFYRDDQVLSPVGMAKRVKGRVGDIHVDQLVLHDNGSVSLRGWANESRPVRGLVVSVGDGPSTPLPLDIPRPDVCAHVQRYKQALCGFDTMVPSGQSTISPPLTMTFQIDWHGIPSSTFRLPVLAMTSDGAMPQTVATMPFRSVFVERLQGLLHRR